MNVLLRGSEGSPRSSWRPVWIGVLALLGIFAVVWVTRIPMSGLKSNASALAAAGPADMVWIKGGELNDQRLSRPNECLAHKVKLDPF